MSTAVNDYVFTDVILNPITKENVDTYIVKDNMKVRFSFANHEIDSNFAMINSYYYMPFKNKNLTIRCVDTPYTSGAAVDIVPKFTYTLLKATNRLKNCLFVFDINYTVKYEGKSIERTEKFYFMIVPESEYDAYNSMKKSVDDNFTKDGEIKKPKKQK